MRVSSSTNSFKKQKERQSRSFGDLATSMPRRQRETRANAGGKRGVVGEKEVTFAPSKPQNKRRPQQQEGGEGGGGRSVGRGKDRRSASGNVFRRM